MRKWLWRGSWALVIVILAGFFWFFDRKPAPS